MDLKKTTLCFIIFILFLLAGCSYTQSFTIEALRAPQENILQKPAKIILVNRTIDPDKKDCGHFFLFDEHRFYDTICLDSLLTEAYLLGMKEIIDDSQLFSASGEILDIAPTADEKYNQPVSSKEITRISKTADADVLIFLDDLQYDDFTRFVQESYYNGFAYTAAVFSAIFRFYDAETSTVIASRTLKDTVYWVSTSMDYEKLYHIAALRKEILPYLAHNEGKKIAAKFFPAWTTENRVLLTSYDAISQNAVAAALAGNWERSNYYWNAVAMGKNKKKASKALFNKGVGEEINGDFEKAIQYVERANTLKKNPLYNDYIKILQQRVKDEEHLK